MSDESPWRPPTDRSDEPPPPPPLTDSAPALPPPPSGVPATPPPGVPATPYPGVPSIPPVPTIPAAVPPTLPTGPGPANWSLNADAPADAIVTSSEPRSNRSGRSKWLVGGALAGVLAVGAAGVFVVSSMGDSAQGGAESPDQLGLDLLTAIENEDALGVIDVLAPGERDVFREPMIEFVSQLTRLEVLSDAADLSRLLGIDVELSNESVTAVSTNVPDITNIAMRADATVSLDGSQIPIGALITDNIPDDMLTEMRGSKVTETDVLEFELTAIETDGRWYFSAFHSIAEVARGDLAEGTLIPVDGIGADGADSPEAAIDNLLAQIEDLDLTGMIRTLNPGEAAALQRYAPLFIDDAESQLANLIAEAGFDWEITESSVRFDGGGDTRTALIDAITIVGSADGSDFSIAIADGCFRAEAQGEVVEQCSSGALEGQDELLAEFPEVTELIDTITEAFADIDEVGLELREFQGAWYVSPTSTMSEAFLSVLRALDRSELDAIIEQAPEAFGEVTEGFFEGLDDLGLDDSVFDDVPGGDTLIGDDLVDADADVDVTDDAVESPDEATLDEAVVGDDFELWDPCYGEPDPIAATECFVAGSAAGGPDVSFMPVVLRHPECDYTVAWGSTVYALPDDEFIAAVEAARPCFLDLLEQGLVSEFELPNEIRYFECFEDRNWYSTYDDPEYDERYFACLEAASVDG